MGKKENQANEFRTSLEECWNALNEAYWASTTNEAKDAITGCSDFISDLIDVMYVQEFASRTAQFNNLAEKIEVGNKKLKELKKKIASLIHKIQAITNVISTIEKVMKFLPLLPL